jgi:choline dehydrogenase-like flavoprotein
VYDTLHHMGATRMASDASRGVVDEHCRVHGVDNLFVAGSSVFPTCGATNPTLTIVALALRLADHLQRLRART